MVEAAGVANDTVTSSSPERTALRGETRDKMRIS